MLPTVTDEQIDKHCDALNAWAVATYAWLQKDLGPYVAERFLFGASLPFDWKLNGPNSAEHREKRSDCINTATVRLSNLDFLMRDPSIYPEKEE